MGRHARGVARSRAPIATVVLGLLIVLVIAGGSWLSSRFESAPVAASLTTGSAVVLSSLACTDGAGGTVVEVLGGSAARATLDGCGYQVGQQLVVQYSLQDPTQVSLAGTTTADPALDQSPFGILLAGLLVVGAAVAVGVVRRRSPRGVTAAVPSALAAGAALGGPTPPPGGRHARAEGTDTDPDDEHPVGSTPPSTVAPTAVQSPAVDLVFPFASTLAASLRDELFTHRSVPT